MSKTVILTEKPSVARDFASALGVESKGAMYFENEKYVICWAFGHLLRPYNPEDYHPKFKKWSLGDLPILPPKLLYSPQVSSKKQLDILATLFKRNDLSALIVATDAGREGELIARTIIGYCAIGLPAKRFWTSEALTPQVINSALLSMQDLKDHNFLYIAGKARQFADWLVGMNLSRLATLKLGSLYSIGRVQTAVLGLIVDRRKLIDQFVQTKFWQYQLMGRVDDIVLKYTWFDFSSNGEKNTHIVDHNKLKQIDESIGRSSLVIDHFTREELSSTPPALYSLTELQRDANKLYSFSAKRTLELAQKLYESGKCLSYPRSDSQHLGVSTFPLVKKIMEMARRSYSQSCQWIDENKISPDNRNVFDDSKLTDHHALIPLDRYRGNSQDERKIYDLVLTRFLQVFSKDADYVDYKITIRCENEYFRAKERVWKDYAWKQIRGHNETQGVDCLNFCSGQNVVCESTKHLEQKTSPPSEYTESTLLKDMSHPARLVEDGDQKSIFRTHVGLGTQSTRAQIIETLIDREYILRNKRNLVATDKGIGLIDQLRKHESLGQLTRASETAEWELQLEKIAQGKLDGLDFINRIKEYVKLCITTWR